MIVTAPVTTSNSSVSKLAVAMARTTCEQIIRANGIDIFVRRHGEGPLVVLCHGWPDVSYGWRHQGNCRRWLSRCRP